MSIMAVLDTNVIVSAFLKKDSNPAKILKEATDGRIIPILQDEIIKEYAEVLNRDKFSFSERIINATINQLQKRGVYFSRLETNEHLPDPKDIVFYEVTMDARQNNEAYLITGNGKHFPTKPFVVTPTEMLEILKKTNQ